MAQIAAPVAREWVCRHPVVSLSVAAVAGPWLVRIKPWQFLGSSMRGDYLARQALSLSLSSGSPLVSLLVATALRGKPAARAPVDATD